MKKTQKKGHRWETVVSIVVIVVCLYLLSLICYREHGAIAIEESRVSTYSGACVDAYWLPFGPVRSLKYDYGALCVKMDNGVTYIVDIYMIPRSAFAENNPETFASIGFSGCADLIIAQVKSTYVTVDYYKSWIFWPNMPYILRLQQGDNEFISTESIYEYWNHFGRDLYWFVVPMLGFATLDVSITLFPIPQIKAYQRRKRKQRKKELRKQRVLEKENDDSTKHNN